MAMRYFNDLQRDIREGLYEGAHECANRYHAQAIRIATIFAAWENPNSPLVTGRTMEAAIKTAHFYLRQARQFIRLASQSRASSDAEEMLKQLRGMFSASKDGTVAISHIHNNCRSPFRGQRARTQRVVDDLESTGEIESVEGLRKGKRYRLGRA